MIRSLYTAASGMLANQLYVDSISNNLANVNTTGYKKAKVEFQDLLYQTLAEPGATTEEGNRKPTGLQVGLGVKSHGNSRIFTEGNLQQTGNPLDIAIEGDGFFQVQRPDGTLGYTRDGSFKISGDGQLVTAQGFYVDPGISIPSDAREVQITADGRVSAVLSGDTVGTELGQLELAQFVNPAGLKSLGGNLYVETEASGTPSTGLPGAEGRGALSQGFVETSNVQLVEEMVNLIVAQRAYEISSKAVQTSDEMLQNANNLRR